ncbi:MAG: cyclase family protein [Gemmatimonadota bacterium]|nr:cyclase family protein [Gemmatimonadota bacterium]
MGGPPAEGASARGGVIDISPPLAPAIAVFPGDTPLTREVLLDTARGDAITLSTLRATVHLGAHVDAPSHTGRGAASIDRLPLERFLGPCRVLRVRGEAGGRIPAGRMEEALDGRPPTERLLLATGSYPDPDRFTAEFTGLEPEVVRRLAERGVRLIGIDTPSVDPADSADLPAHAACLAHDVAILEGLVLSHVPEGVYELVALPLRLVGFDASPVRAALRPM